jgi:hypothetical protein
MALQSTTSQAGQNSVWASSIVFLFLSGVACQYVVCEQSAEMNLVSGRGRGLGGGGGGEKRF